MEVLQFCQWGDTISQRECCICVTLLEEEHEFLSVCFHLIVGLHFTWDHNFPFCDLLRSGIFFRRIDLVFRVWLLSSCPGCPACLCEVLENVCVLTSQRVGELILRLFLSLLWQDFHLEKGCCSVVGLAFFFFF